MASEGISARVVSLPCWELFFAQDEAYRAGVLGTDLLRVSVEAASTFGWERLVGSDGLMIGLDQFGASASAEVLAERFGFTASEVTAAVVNRLSGGGN
ncbi:MAG: hypothetical protein JJE47_16550 [Acidimicrobiia bacterium]|nr:hypothetical protein [Acidimicrobiia bacterium]